MQMQMTNVKIVDFLITIVISIVARSSFSHIYILFYLIHI